MDHACTRREWLGWSAAAALGVAQRAVAADPAPRPNIVLIFCDDLGYGDLGCYGADRIKTPRLDRMAAEGMRFTDFYSCSPVCTPSRAGLLTGRHPLRVGMPRVLFPQSETGLPDSETTIAELLRDQGYATACIGKWHLGHLPPFLPTRHGFDAYFGIPYSNDMEVTHRGDPPLPLMRNEDVIEAPVPQETLTRRYTDEAVRIIRETKDRPFFIYLAHSMPHVPLFASDDFRGKSEAGLYGDVIEEIDWSTGAILDALDESGHARDTLVIFTSDNGPWLIKKEHGGSAGPLRMGKGCTFDGGVRVPCIARMPGYVPEGAVERGPAWTLDLLPTFAALGGTLPPGDRPHDGLDLRDVLTGKTPRPDSPLIFHENENVTAIRLGDWKLKRAFDGLIYASPLKHETLLFNLAKDPGEQINLAEKHPDIAADLEARLAAFEAGLQA